MTDWENMRAVLAGIPALPGARCKGQADLYERTDSEHHMTGRLTKTEVENARIAALSLCQSCPALDSCRAWFGALPTTQRPHGVVAGQVITAGGKPSKTRTKPDEQPAPDDRQDAAEHAHLVRPRTQGEASPHPAQGAPRGI
ncbi:hypothetical protein, partial [Mycobacterium kiyosense]|uniref:hypothetical protein n=1 Tax=Mycobacterium kiyosense TaxID=2871094 RepID=UPI0022318911